MRKNLLLLLGALAVAVALDVPLATGWRLRGLETKIEVPAAVPGTVQTDLLAAGRISDPYWGFNEREQRWIAQETWEYFLNFTIPAEGSARLIFEGLDTFASVWLDGSPLGEASNAHRRWSFDLPHGPAAAPGTHELRVRFRPVESVTAPLAAAGARPLPCDQYAPPASAREARGPRFNRSFARKPGVDYGWNWAPALLPVGIHRPARLQILSGPTITYLSVQRQSVGDDGSFLVSLRCFLHAPPPVLPTPLPSPPRPPFLSSTPGGAHGSRSARRAKRDPRRRLGLALRACAGPGAGGVRDAARQVSLQAGASGVPLSIAVKPGSYELWWPNGLGARPLYALEGTYTPDSGAPASLSVQFGFRTVEWVQSADTAGGASFYARVNGRPVFLKGAAWVPPDAFEPRVSAERVWHLAASAAAAGMNALRVWGGGSYAPAALYEAADRLGLLIWQDFAFACCLYPADDAFLENVRHEVEQQVRRLSSHASLALWCGGNENELALAEWYNASVADPAPYRADYERLVYGTVGATVAKEDPGRLFWPSSPSSGPRSPLPPNAEGAGDLHYWPRWSALAGDPVDGAQDWANPYAEFLAGYRRLRPRFASEFGALAFPSAAELGAYAPPGQLHPVSPFLQWRTRSPFGNVETLGKIGQWFRETGGDDYGRFAYLSQVLQGYTLRNAIEHFRRLAPRTMGALYWQLNDIWPGPSESTLEHSGAWRASHYAARAAFRSPLAPSALQADAGALELWVANDGPHDALGTLHAHLWRWDGARPARELEFPFAVPAAAAALAARLKLPKLFAPAPPDEAEVRGLPPLLAAQAPGRVRGARPEPPAPAAACTPETCFLALYIQRGAAPVERSRPDAWHPFAPPKDWDFGSAVPHIKLEGGPFPEGDVEEEGAGRVCGAGGEGAAPRKGLRLSASSPVPHAVLEAPRGVPGWFTQGDALLLPGAPLAVGFCPWSPAPLEPARAALRHAAPRKQHKSHDHDREL
eukprot:tig00021612_g22864.t1